MNAHFLIFKGTPRWRDPLFWTVLAIFGALLGWNLHRGVSLWPVLIWSPFYATTIAPPRLFLSENWLFYLGSSWVFWRLQRFEKLESYSFWEGANQAGQRQDVNVTLTLVSTKGPRCRNVLVSIQKGAQLAAFMAAMEARGVPSLEARLHETLANSELPGAVFSPPFSSIEAEREALYRLLDRPMPKM